MGTKHSRWLILLLSLLMLAEVTQGGVTSKKPKLMRVVMYKWALSIGGVSVDLRTRRMECFARGSKISEGEQQELKKRAAPGYPMFHIVAALSAKEVCGLRSLVSKSSLRGFAPKDSDLRKRPPALDECPSTLVLMWSDKNEDFCLPLSGTVRSDLAARRKHAYEGMNEVCRYLELLEDRYDRAPWYTSTTLPSWIC